MSRMNVWVVGLAALCLIASASAQPAHASAGGGPGGADNGRGSGGGGMGFNAKHAQDQLAAIRDVLGVVDDEEEWKTLSAKIEKVTTAKRNMGSGAGMSWTSSNNAPPTFEASRATPATAPGKAMQELRDAVAEPDAPKDALVGKVAAMRKARQKARAEYDAAQEALLGALTPRQEAMLMTLGVVD